MAARWYQQSVQGTKPATSDMYRLPRVATSATRKARPSAWEGPAARAARSRAAARQRRAARAATARAARASWAAIASRAKNRVTAEVLGIGGRQVLSGGAPAPGYGAAPAAR